MERGVDRLSMRLRAVRGVAKEDRGVEPPSTRLRAVRGVAEALGEPRGVWLGVWREMCRVGRVVADTRGRDDIAMRGVRSGVAPSIVASPRAWPNPWPNPWPNQGTTVPVGEVRDWSLAVGSIPI